MRPFFLLLGIAMYVTTFVALASNTRDPLDYPLKQYLLLLTVSLLGGLVSWYAKIKAGTVKTWNLMHLIGELATSAFAGLLALWLCAYFDVPPLLMAAFVGIAGHMGTRAITVFEQWATRKFPSFDTTTQRDSKRGDL
mgnify:CR=1 FL=1